MGYPQIAHPPFRAGHIETYQTEGVDSGETVSGMDAAVEPTWTYLRRVSPEFTPSAESESANEREWTQIRKDYPQIPQIVQIEGATLLVSIQV